MGLYDKMLLTISTTYQPATDLGFLLYKHPEKLQTFELSCGKAHVFYPERSAERCTAALLLEIDPVGLVRGRSGPAGEGGLLEQYVNDRPYVASSFLSVAIAQVFGTALSGRCKDRPELADTPIPLEARLAVLPCRGGEGLLRRLFEPLGYALTATQHVLDPTFAEWGVGRYFTVSLSGVVRLQDLLTHLYVLIPVLDDEKHYWVNDDEVEKLLRQGGDWLAAHPEKELIASRYLRRQRHLVRAALARLLDEDQAEMPEAETRATRDEQQLEQQLSLNEQRMGAVIAAVRNSGARRVIDLGCGEGKLLRTLLQDRSFTEIAGMDVSHRALEIAAERLHLNQLPAPVRERIRLFQGSLIYRDDRLAGYDAATVIEVVEHLDSPRLRAFERVLFEFAKPSTIVLTTPNVEYNQLFAGLAAGQLRHRDHRFEWSREEFRQWTGEIAQRFGYSVRLLPVGTEHAELGPPTQMAVFTR